MQWTGHEQGRMSLVIILIARNSQGSAKPGLYQDDSWEDSGSAPAVGDADRQVHSDVCRRVVGGRTGRRVLGSRRWVTATGLGSRLEARGSMTNRAFQEAKTRHQCEGTEAASAPGPVFCAVLVGQLGEALPLPIWGACTHAAAANETQDLIGSIPVDRKKPHP